MAGWPGGRLAGWPVGQLAGWPGGRVPPNVGPPPLPPASLSGISESNLTDRHFRQILNPAGRNDAFLTKKRPARQSGRMRIFGKASGSFRRKYARRKITKSPRADRQGAKLVFSAFLLYQAFFPVFICFRLFSAALRRFRLLRGVSPPFQLCATFDCCFHSLLFLHFSVSLLPSAVVASFVLVHLGALLHLPLKRRVRRKGGRTFRRRKKKSGNWSDFAR